MYGIFLFNFDLKTAPYISGQSGRPPERDGSPEKGQLSFVGMYVFMALGLVIPFRSKVQTSCTFKSSK